MKFNTTARGFAIYGEFEDSKGSKIRVQESSVAGMDAVWIFAQGLDSEFPPSPHLDKEQVEKLIEILEIAAENMEYTQYDI